MDEPLAHRAQRGDEEAFRALYRAVHPGLRRYLRVLVGDQDADDVASETWLQLVRDLGRFRGNDDAFRAWAATVGRNRATDHLRRQRRRPATPEPAEVFEDLSGSADPEAAAQEAVSTERALGMIASLPRDQAEAVLLRVVMGLDARAAGRVLGKRPGAVRVAAHRGLRRLAERLAAPDAAAPDAAAPDAAAPDAAAGRAGVTGRRAATLEEMV